jgi:hypothetical protein
MSACGMVACWCASGFRVDRLRRRGVVCACLWDAPLLTAVVVIGKPYQTLRTGLARHSEVSKPLLAPL